MKKTLLVLMTLSFLSPALACSRVPGYMAKGLVRLPAGATSSCGSTYKRVAQNFRGPGEWAELYFISPSRLDSVLRSLKVGLATKGYDLASDRAIDAVGSRQLGFINTDTSRVVFVQYGEQDGRLLMSVDGK